MANIVTWQERGINLLATKNASKDILNVLTKVHFVQFATFQQPEHERQILGREVTSCLKPIASSHSDMSKTSLWHYHNFWIMRQNINLNIQAAHQSH